jgi:hypothetical protein
VNSPATPSHVRVKSVSTQSRSEVQPKSIA